MDLSVDEICAENLRLTSELQLRDMQIRQLSHQCLGEAIRILRKLLMRNDCDIPGESWLMLAIGTMEDRQKEISEQQLAALAGKPEPV